MTRLESGETPKVSTFHERMTEIAGASAAGDASLAWEQARALRELLKRTNHAPDPQQLGWTRYYELRSLYQLRRWRDGLALMDEMETERVTLSDRNAAWMYGAAAEMAYHAGEPARVVTYMAEALCLRLADDDLPGAETACENAFALLDSAGEPQLLDEFIAAAEAMPRRYPVGSRQGVNVALTLSRIARRPWFQNRLPSSGRRTQERSLHAAAAAGDVVEVGRLLLRGVNPSATCPTSPGLPTPLIVAAYNGHEAVVARLVHAEAEMEAANVQGRTALHQAADQDRAAVVSRLCSLGANLGATDYHEHTALHVAAWQGHEQSVVALVEAGAPLELRDVNGDTALALASSEPVPDVVRALIRAGADVDALNAYDQTPLIRAAQSGHMENVELLLAAGADTARQDAHRMTAAAWARYEGFDTIAAMLDAFMGHAAA